MTEPTRETPASKVSAEVKPSPIITPLPEPGSPSNVPARNASIEEFLRRNEEVLEKDREEFKTYLVAKHEEATRQAKAEAAKPKTKTRMSRRAMLNVAVGTAATAEVAVLGYSALNGQRR